MIGSLTLSDQLCCCIGVVFTGRVLGGIEPSYKKKVSETVTSLRRIGTTACPVNMSTRSEGGRAPLGSARTESPLGGLSRDRRSPELARLFSLSPSLKCLSHPAGDRGRRQGQGGKGGRRERASRARKAERTPGAGQGRSPLARSARLSAAAAVFSLPLTLLLTGPRRTRRTAEPPASCRSAAGRNKSRLQPQGGERPDSRLARSAAPRGAKLRPAAAPGLPSSGVSLPVSPASGIGLTGTRMQPDLGTRVPGLPPHSTVLYPNPGAATQTPPAHQYANTRQHPGTEPPAEKHVLANPYAACAAGPACAHSGRRLGVL